MILVLVLGVVAGALTTVAGMGGGLLLVVALSLLWDPRIALATTSLALFVSNAHRLFLYRDQVEPRAAGHLVLGVFPGALIGGLLTVAIPETALRAIIFVVVGLAIARALRGWSWTLPTRALVPAGLLVGALTATAGGAGLLVAPLLLATGLTGERYVATAAFAATAMHVGRIIGYGAGGLVDAGILVTAAALALALMTGNLVGRVLRQHLSIEHSRRLEYGTLFACAILSVVAVA